TRLHLGIAHESQFQGLGIRQRSVRLDCQDPTVDSAPVCAKIETVVHDRLEVVLHEPLLDQVWLRERAPDLFRRIRYLPFDNNGKRFGRSIGHLSILLSRSSRRWMRSRASDSFVIRRGAHLLQAFDHPRPTIRHGAIGLLVLRPESGMLHPKARATRHPRKGPLHSAIEHIAITRIRRRSALPSVDQPSRRLEGHDLAMDDAVPVAHRLGLKGETSAPKGISRSMTMERVA